MDGADARLPEVAVVSCRPAHCVQPLTQLHGRIGVVGAQQQLAGFGFAQQQDVGSTQRHRQRLAGAGARDAQHRSLQSPDQLPLSGVQPRVESQNHGRDAQVVGQIVGHVYFLQVWLICLIGIGQTGRGRRLREAQPSVRANEQAPVAIGSTGACSL